MVQRERLWVDSDEGRIAVLRWGSPDADKPAALLVHGTGFVGEVWEEVAAELASRFVVYAIDRRGHGASHKPAPGQYHFVDFARDLYAVMDTLCLSDVFGIGHSAGATDLLLAAKHLPGRFARIFAMEPTVMDPRARRSAEFSDEHKIAVARTLRRRAEFASSSAALERLRAAPAFAHWTDRALRAYVAHGFAATPDGTVRLCCTPEIEAAMLVPIFEAMEQLYDGDGRGAPFENLADIDCPVRVSSAEHSAPIYKEMAARALTLMPRASAWRFDAVGHCAAQEAPALVLEALEAFASSPLAE